MAPKSPKQRQTPKTEREFRRGERDDGQNSRNFKTRIKRSRTLQDLETKGAGQGRKAMGERHNPTGTTTKAQQS